VHSQDSPQDPLRFLLENIMPMLNKNIIIEKIRIVRSIVVIYISKFKAKITEVPHQI
jgi:hypothetical protein